MKQLIQRICSSLSRYEYALLPGPSSGAIAVMTRPFEDLHLSTGIEVSRWNRNRFTSSFYLSYSLHWGYVVPGFPGDAYKRVGHFLHAKERKRLLDAEFCESGVVDAWWNATDELSVSAFLEAHHIAEARFLKQPSLVKRLHECDEMRQHKEMIDLAGQYYDKLKSKPRNCTLQPDNTIPKVPRKWFWAAECVLREREPELVSRSYVELLAVDSWRSRLEYERGHGSTSHIQSSDC